jgi:hypothetical protein
VNRAYACTRKQALLFVNDGRPEFVALAEAVIAAPTSGVTFTVVTMTTAQPGMTPESTDADLDAAVQFVWPLVGSTLVNEAPA